MHKTIHHFFILLFLSFSAFSQENNNKYKSKDLNGFKLKNSQNYQFDVQTKYSIDVNGKSNETTVYSNSKNEDYFLRINPWGSKSKASIFDFKKHVIHNLKIVKKKIYGI